MPNFLLRSSAFQDGAPIPKKYTRDGDNVAPPLQWSDPPAGTKSFALVMYDPDAPNGTFHHWAVFNIMPDRTLLPEGMTGGAKTESLGHGRNDFGNGHYDGPQPPKGHGTHHYHFRLMALNTPHLDLSAAPSVQEVWRAAKPFVVGEAELVGIYSR